MRGCPGKVGKDISLYISAYLSIYIGHSPKNWTKEGAAFSMKLKKSKTKNLLTTAIFLM